MELRPIFTPTITSERIQLIEARIREIEDALEKAIDVDNLIGSFNEFTGKSYEKYYFQTYWSTQSREEFATDAALPVAVKVADITKEELIEIVNRILEGDSHTLFFLEILRINTTYPRVSNLIFWPTKEGLAATPSSEEIVNAALSYKANQL